MIMRASIPEQTLNPNFIGAWYLSDASLCDELVRYFNDRKGDQIQGVTGDGFNPQTKLCTDLQIRPKEVDGDDAHLIDRYLSELYTFFLDYTDQWPFIKVIAPEVEIGQFNIQRYAVGEHFQKVHTERSGIQTLHRIFAWMTYLNDVDTGGTTNFYHYGIQVSPKKGLTLIWPAEWTHAHAGDVIKKGEKYIITGWMNFFE